MSFVNRSGGEQKRQTRSVAGAPPGGFEALGDFDPADPETVKVHYDIAGWTFDQRAQLTEVLAEIGLPHGWDGEELVVPEAAEEATDALFAQLEQVIGPFAVPLDDDEPATEFLLDEWPQSDLDTLRLALVDAEIPHRWDGERIFVASDADDVVDDLLDAIERGDIASFDESDGDGPPDGVLGDLYAIGDRLARDPDSSAPRRKLLDLAGSLDPRHPPFGMAVRAWATVVAATESLVEEFTAEEGPDAGEVIEHATQLRTVTRPYV